MPIINKFTFLFILLAFVVVLFIFKKEAIVSSKSQHTTQQTFHQMTSNSHFNQPASKKIIKKSLIDIYKGYDGVYGFYHWLEYADRYEYHLKLLLSEFSKTQTVKMLEIGVLYGGSVEVWKEYFSQRHPLYYVGMDRNKDCKRTEDANRGIFIEIGSQASVKDLLVVCKKHGPFDFIIDDGGHTYDMMRVSYETLFTSDLCMTRNSLYVIEDMHTMVSKKFGKNPFDISTIPAELFRKMHYYWYTGEKFKNQLWDAEITDQDKKWADTVKSISLYDSMMFVHRGKGTGPLTVIRKGKIWSFKNETIPKVKRL